MLSVIEAVVIARRRLDIVDADCNVWLVLSPIQLRGVCGDAVYPAVQRFCLSELADVAPSLEKTFLRQDHTLSS